MPSILELGTLAVSVVSAFTAAYIAFVKLRPETEKTKAETERAHADADKTHADADYTEAQGADILSKAAIRLLEETEGRLRDDLQTLRLELEVERQKRRALEVKTAELLRQLETERQARNDSTLMLQRLLNLERERRSELERGLRVLLEQMRTHKIEPKWTPPLGPEAIEGGP